MMWNRYRLLAPARTLTLALALSALLGSASPLRAQATSRDSLLNAFDGLRDEYRRERIYDPNGYLKLKVYVPRGRETVPIEVYNGTAKDKLDNFRGVAFRDDSGAPQNAKLMVKVWAKPMVGDRTGEKMVHISKYRWKPGERMAIYFKSASDVQVQFFQEFERGDKSRVQVLPDPEYPKSLETIKGGYAVRFPVNIDLDRDEQDELMVITVMAANSDASTTTHDPNFKQGMPAKNHVVFGREHGEALRRKAEEARYRYRFKASASSDANLSSQEIDPGSDVESMTDPDKVAMIAYGQGTLGELKIRIHKRPD